MKVTFNPDRKRYEAKSERNERHLFDYTDPATGIVSCGGWRWDAENFIWQTSKPEAAARLAAYADEPTREMLKDFIGKANEVATEAHEKAKADIKLSRATDADIEIPAPEGLAYLPYQKAGIAYAVCDLVKGGASPSRPGVLIADEMG